MAKIPLIRTGLRDKLPRGMSFPIGAEAISQAVVGWQRYDDSWIAFCRKPDQPVYFTIGQESFALAFSVEIKCGPRACILLVPAVPSESCHVVKQLLKTAGLAKVREWLLHPRPETWYSGIRQFQVGYALDPPRIGFIEYDVKRGMCKEYKHVIASSVSEIPVVHTRG